MAETTCKCSECYYHRKVDDIRTCGLQHTFLDNNVVGCYGGYKQRNKEAEQALKRSVEKVTVNHYFCLYYRSEERNLSNGK